MDQSKLSEGEKKMVALFLQKVENDMRILNVTTNSAGKKTMKIRTIQESLTYQNMWDTHKVHIMYMLIHL